MDTVTDDVAGETEIDIPCYFLCPISMQLMTDPVTTSTGITYDRQTIEKWLFSPCRLTRTCPVTKQPLPDPDLTPNHTLRRLIQSWCALNSLDRIPSPKPAADKPLIQKILGEARRSPESKLASLRRLRSIAARNESGKNRLQAAGAVDFLVSVVRGDEDAVSRDEALGVLLEMNLSDSDVKAFFEPGSGRGVVEALVRVLGEGSRKDREQAISLLKAAIEVADPTHLIGSDKEIFIQTISILRDRSISHQGTKSALKLLLELCPWGRNRVKAIEAGAVCALIEMLFDQAVDKRACELTLAVLDQLCNCAEGRAELLGHGAGLAVVSKKILRVSNAASDKGVRILGSISKYSGSTRVLQEMLHVGVVTKLCLVQQVEVNQKTKERAKEILRMHSRVWKGSSCVPRSLLSTYPSS